MSDVIRLAGALLVATAVIVAGTFLFEAVGVGSLAWFGLITIAMIAGSLADRERFYGLDSDGPDPTHTTSAK